MEADKGQLFGEKQAVEQEKTGLREELVRVEQEKLDLDSEKSGITQTLELTEESRERLEEEIVALNKDRAELTEQLNAVSSFLCIYLSVHKKKIILISKFIYHCVVTDPFLLLTVRPCTRVQIGICLTSRALV